MHNAAHGTPQALTAPALPGRAYTQSLKSFIKLRVQLLEGTMTNATVEQPKAGAQALVLYHDSLAHALQYRAEMSAKEVQPLC